MEEEQCRTNDKTAVLLACFLGFTGANNFYIGSPIDAFAKYILGLVYILLATNSKPFDFIVVTSIISVIEALLYTIYGAYSTRDIWNRARGVRGSGHRACGGRKKHIVIVSVYAVFICLLSVGLLQADFATSQIDSQEKTNLNVQSEKPMPGKKSANLDNGIVGVTWFYLGNDSSQLIYLPDDTCALIAPKDEASAQSVVVCLQEKDIERLDYLIVLGRDESEIKGAQYIDTHLSSDSLWISQDASIENNAFTTTSIHKVASAGEIDSGNEFSLGMKVNKDLSPYVLATYKATEFVFAQDLQPFSCDDPESLKQDTLVSLSEISNIKSCEKDIPEAVKHTVLSCDTDEDSRPSYELVEQMRTTDIFGTGSNGVIVATSDGDTIDVKVQKDAAVEFAPAKVDAEEVSDTTSLDTQDSESSGSTTCQPDSDKDFSSDANSSSESSSSSDSYASSSQSDSAQSSSGNVSSVDDNSRTVYLTNSGKKYHEDGCKFLRKSKIPTTLGEAKARGIKPCSVCH